MHTQKLTTRVELRAFLRAKRAVVDPAVVGFARARRRKPGLRIEEVATLAGVGTTWYAAFERGEPIGVSKKMTDSVARALRLSPVEREYLDRLLGPGETLAEIDGPLGDPFVAVVDGFAAGPAFAMNGRWDILAANARAREVYGFDPHGDELARNLLRRMLLDPSYRTLHAGWAELAASMVGTFHFEFGRRLHDARYVALVEELRACAPDFRTVWDAFTLVPYEPYEIELQRAHGFERYRLTKLLGTVSTGTEPLAVIVQTPLASGASEPVTHSV